MKEGQIFTIEPMVNMGTYRDMTWPDGWTAVTADGKRSAQFEHTLLVTASGCDVLTKRPANLSSTVVGTAVISDWSPHCLLEQKLLHVEMLL